MHILKKIKFFDKKNFKRVSIISDNLDLSKFVFEQFKKSAKNLKIRVRFYNSPLGSEFNLSPFVKSKTINLKVESELDELIDNSDIVLSLHCKQIFPKKLVESRLCINFHPGFNPFNRGWYPQAFSIVNGLPIGATIHVMDEKIDFGSVIVQKEIQIEEHETSFDAYRKIIELEKQLITENLEIIISGNFESKDMAHPGNTNYKKDFENLCKLELDSIGTLRDHIDLLRATSHGGFRNAYFVDSRGDKCFVKIIIEK
jgi:methionyl-tRNA formyltransferase